MQSLVCYTFCDRRCWKWGCFLNEQTVSGDCRTAGFCQQDKTRLFECITEGAEGISNPPQRCIVLIVGTRSSFSLTNKKSTVKAMQLPVNQLHPFEGHPFQVKDDAEMDQLLWSIFTQGVLTPIAVRQLEDKKI